MQSAGKTYEPVIYPGAGHGFMRAGEAPDAIGRPIARRTMPPGNAGNRS